MQRIEDGPRAGTPRAGKLAFDPVLTEPQEVFRECQREEERDEHRAPDSLPHTDERGHDGLLVWRRIGKSFVEQLEHPAGIAQQSEPHKSARLAKPGGKFDLPPLSLALVQLLDHHVTMFLEGVRPHPKWTRRPGQLGIGVLHHLEGVVVEAHPDMEAVLFDPVAVARLPVPTARALPTQTPTHLIHRDLVATPPVAPAGQGKGGCQRAEATAEDGDLLDRL